MTEDNQPDEDSCVEKRNDAEPHLPNTARDPKQSATEGDLVEGDSGATEELTPQSDATDDQGQRPKKG